DDGSTDRTPTLAEALTTRNPLVRLLRHETHRGFGAALRTGLAAAQHPLLVYCPGDLSYQPADLKVMLKWIDEVHLVAGYRASAPGTGQRLWTRWPYRWLARMVFGVHMRDLGCRFLLARRSIFARIPIQSDGPFAHIEVLAKANFCGCMMTEVPVSYQEPASGEAARWDDDWGRTRAEARRVLFPPRSFPAALTDPSPPAAAGSSQLIE